MDTPVVRSVKTRRRSSATSTPRRTPVRSQSKLVRKLLTLFTLKNVRSESILNVMKLMREVITAPVWSITTPRSLLLLNMVGTKNIMEDIILTKADCLFKNVEEYFKNKC